MAGDSKSSKQFDVDGLRQLLELMEKYDIREFKQQVGETRYVLRRGPHEVVSAAPVTYAAAPAMAAPTPSVAPQAPAAAAPTASGADEGLIPIKSPTVGTFYIAQAPGEPPFCKVGDTVTAESIVCIVEAMKLFNKIPAKVSGTIAKILLADGDAVEFGQPMFLVKP
ncbi:acetyl-CoA carboxylase biotin carboxyl carrier protein [Planctomicrobium sp. SH668]|uniref:acetyl-CoA carboxylase biotin carboxyl carrier protein n=1 Tax=Planctomicrobium sp. SH668 TaxID=3448126 RepID=UPI003F5B1A50